jgi:hypothetical protein
LAYGGIQGKPEPLPVRFRTDKAPEFVHFSLQSVQDHRLGACWWPDIQIIRSGGKVLDDNLLGLWDKTSLGLYSGQV